MTENLLLRSLTDIATIPWAPRPVVFLLADETIDQWDELRIRLPRR